MDRFFVLNSPSGDIKLSINIERVEIGEIGIINLLNTNLSKNIKVELLLSDEECENVYEIITEWPYRFFFPSGFNTKGKILVDVFSGGKAIISGTINGKESKFDACLNNGTIFNKQQYVIDPELKEEAAYYINRAKQMYAEKNPSFFETIRGDFELLYDIGSVDYLLAKKFSGSTWKKIEVDDKVYLLGKFMEGEKLKKIALAVPSVSGSEKGLKEASLGSRALFYPATIYDDFGFWVLVQDANTGYAEKI